MFGNIEIARKIEAAEARLAVANAEVQRTRKKAASVSVVAGGVAVYIGPGSPMNKVVGLGLDDDRDLNALSPVEEEWKKSNEPVRIELCTLVYQDFSDQLMARGYRLQGFENVLARPLSERINDAAIVENAEIEMVRDKDGADRWIEVMVASFGNPDHTGSVADPDFDETVLRDAFEDAAATSGYHRYLGKVDGAPVSAASLRMDGDLAQVAGAGTLPAFRGKGLQKMLLQRRLMDAQSAGCVLATVTTAPGSRSQQNMMRHGFELLYSRAVLVRGWSTEASVSSASS
jgi:GNAT superfamily N-acetyltransferase